MNRFSRYCVFLSGACALMFSFTALSAEYKPSLRIRDHKVLPFTFEPAPIPMVKTYKDPLIDSIMNPRFGPYGRDGYVRILDVNGDKLIGRVIEIGHNFITFVEMPTGLLKFGGVRTINFADIVFFERLIDQDGNQWPQYPTPEPTHPEDATLSCSDLERTLVFANIFRVSINKDIQRIRDHKLGKSKHAQRVMNAYLLPLIDSRNAFHARIVNLLNQWSGSGCTSKAIAMDPSQLETLNHLLGQMESEDENPETVDAAHISFANLLDSTFDN